MILLTIFLGLSHVIHYQAGNFLEYFMITGPATKITNLGAMKIVLGMRHFIYYIVFVMLFACGTGIAVNVLV